MDLLGLFAAGALLCNSIPHLASGLKGETFYTPWARPRGVGQSSPLQNFLWGAGNLLLAIVLIVSNGGSNVPAAVLALAAGFVSAGTGLSVLFGRRRARSGRSGTGAGRPPGDGRA